MKHSLLLSAAAALLFVQPALAAKKVYSPIVEQGEWEVEHYGSYGREHGGDDRYQYKSYTGVGYGLTDWWKVEAEAILTDENGTNLTYDATELVNHFQFWEEGEMPFDMGLYLAYEMPRRDAEADKVEAIFLVEKNHGSSVHRFNLILEREVGSKSDDETEWGIAWASMWDMNLHGVGDFDAGFEYYAAFGELGDEGRYSQQEHQIGPVVEFDLPGTEVEMKLGYLAGISRAAFDSTVKWELEWEF